MKALLILLLCAVSPMCSMAQRAVTDEGRVVILSSDGTWSYEQKVDDAKASIPANLTPLNKEPRSSFALKSTKNGSVFWIDPKEWSFKKGDNGSPAEYKFQMKGADLYAMAITEAIQIDLGNLVALALENAKTAAPDARVVKQEFRTVNGSKVLYMEIAGTISGIKFRYLGHYFSNSSGSTQFIVYTGENLVSKYATEISSLLNGLSVRE